jgi:hypothetical protein
VCGSLPLATYSNITARSPRSCQRKPTRCLIGAKKPLSPPPVATVRKASFGSGRRQSVILSFRLHSALSKAVQRGAKFGGVLPQPFVCLADGKRMMWREFRVSVGNHRQHFGNRFRFAITARWDHCPASLVKYLPHLASVSHPLPSRDRGGEPLEWRHGAAWPLTWRPDQGLRLMDSREGASHSSATSRVLEKPAIASYRFRALKVPVGAPLKPHDIVTKTHYDDRWRISNRANVNVSLGSEAQSQWRGKRRLGLIL